MDKESPHEVLTVKEFCELLRVHPSTVYKLIRQDKIPRFRHCDYQAHYSGRESDQREKKIMLYPD